MFGGLIHNETDDPAHPNKSVNPDENIFLVERQLFLRAALQLLDERENLISNELANSSANRTPFRSEVIRVGLLGKANRRNALTSVAPRVWKNKVVEIKYGMFYYEDECFSKTDQIENVWRKSIPLAYNFTTCREVVVKGTHEDCIFQLATTGGVKRTFLASNPEDRDAWMKAIYVAMAHSFLHRNPSWGTAAFGGVLGGSNLTSGNTTTASLGLSVIDNKVIDKKKSFVDIFTGGRRAVADNLAWLQNPESMALLMVTSQTSFPGPAAKYAQEVSQFCTEQAKFAASTTPEEFLQTVQVMRDNNIAVRVPVFFVKVGDCYLAICL